MDFPMALIADDATIVGVYYGPSQWTGPDGVQHPPEAWDRPDFVEIIAPWTRTAVVIADQPDPALYAVSGSRAYLVDGAVMVEWIAAARPLDEVKASRVADLRTACGAAILGGYVSEALGVAHTYPNQTTDQSNMAASVVASLMPGLPPDWTTPFWCADADGVWAMRPHTAAQIQQAGADAKAWVLACQAKLSGGDGCGGLIKAALDASTGVEVMAVAWG